MKTQIPLMIFVAGIGLLIGLLLQKPGDSSADSPTSPTAVSSSAVSPVVAVSAPQPMETTELDELKDEIGDLTTLREMLKQEVQARKQLETRLTAMKARLDSLEDKQSDEPSETQASATTTATTTTIRTQNRRGVTRPGWLNVQALVDAGVNEFQANKIRDTYENVEMERLYLRDRAIREGWIGDERYRQESEQLDTRLTSLRDDLTEKEYDAFLFATGRPNRVVIESTLSTSPAREAGIKAGDNVIRYNNTRTYTWSDLRDATTQCQADSMVEVELDRAGQRQRVYVPCGPLGVRLDNTSVKP